MCILTSGVILELTNKLLRVVALVVWKKKIVALEDSGVHKQTLEGRGFGLQVL